MMWRVMKRVNGVESTWLDRLDMGTALSELKWLREKSDIEDDVWMEEDV